MRWIQARDENGRPTVNALAIVETIVAVGASFWLVWHVGLAPLVIGATLAPLLLLRTERSTRWGLVVFRRSAKYYQPEFILRMVRRTGLLSAVASTICGMVVFIVSGLALTLAHAIVSHGWYWWAVMGCLTVVFFSVAAFYIMWCIWSSISFLIILGGVSLLSVCIRITTTAASAMFHPVEAVRAIPTNWSKVALSDNVVLVPELVAGIADDAVLSERFTPKGFASLYRSDARFLFVGFEAREDAEGTYLVFSGIVLVGLEIALALLFLPALLYRFSLKSTSYLYLLLLGVIGVLYGKYRVFGDAPAKERLGHASQDRVSLVFGLVTFGGVIVLPIGVIALVRVAGARLPAMPVRFAFVVDFFTVHPTFGWSNVMQLSNAALAVLTLPVAWLAVRCPRFMGVADHGVRLMAFTRGVLTVGLILWFLAVVWYRVGWDGLTEFFAAVIETIRGVEFDPSLPGPAP